MKINKILLKEDMADNVKVQAIAKIVSDVRAKYGNEDKEIDTPEVSTVDGIVDMKYLSDESKLALADSEFTNIKLLAIEFCKSFDGAILDRKVEELLAISPIMANLLVSTESEYL